VRGGRTEVTGSPEEGFEATVCAKGRPVKANVQGAGSQTDMVPDQSNHQMQREVRRGAGFAKARRDVSLAPVDGAPADL